MILVTFVITAPKESEKMNETTRLDKSKDGDEERRDDLWHTVGNSNSRTQLEVQKYNT